ncbi:MAG: hypothetical protein ACOVQN_07065 [Exiguobacterium sp.]
MNPAGTIYKVVMHIRFGEVAINHVFHFRQKINGLSALDCANQLSFHLKEWWFVGTTNQLILYSVSAQNMSTNANEVGVHTYQPPQYGIVPEQCAPVTLAVVSAFLTAKWGRSFRGRVYRCGFPVSIIENGKVSNSFIMFVQAVNDILLSNYGENGSSPNWEFGVYSKKLGGYSFPYSQAGFTPYNRCHTLKDFGSERGRNK